jgi:protein-disulfide isomerase/uncharacterized membrane protein
MRTEALSPRHWWLMAVLLAAAGFSETAYLTGRALDLAASRHAGAPDLCSVLFGTSCDATLTDARFWILRVPMAGLGLVYFTTLCGLLFLSRFTKGAFESEALLAGSLLAAFGFAAGLALTAWAISLHAPVCPLCLSVHAISLLLVLALRRASAQSLAGQLRGLRSAVYWFARSREETPEPVRWKLVGFASVALLAAFTYQWVYVESALRRPPEARPRDAKATIAEFDATPRLELPVTGTEPHLGPLTAQVRLVVFESFRCPGCRSMAATLARMRETFGDQVLIVYKHYPLSTECNTRMTHDMQPGACEIAWAAEAAHRQSSFWPFHDAIFAAGPSRDAIADAVRGLKLDPVRFDSDRHSGSTMARVAADIALGDRLQIPGTPALFLDGRRVPSAGSDALEILIRRELGRRVVESPRPNEHVMGTGRLDPGGRPAQGG